MKPQDFLNPTSMLTPGLAGGLMMFIVNGLLIPFPELPARWVALVLSFAIGAAIALAAKDAAAKGGLQRAVLWCLNSLVIFVMGFGANSFGRDASEPASPPDSGRAIAWILPSAYAQTQTQLQTPPPAAPKDGEKKADPSASGQPSKDQASASPQPAPGTQKKKTEAPRDTGFFKKW
jgi:hypothetical protein